MPCFQVYLPACDMCACGVQFFSSSKCRVRPKGLAIDASQWHIPTSSMQPSLPSSHSDDLVQLPHFVPAHKTRAMTVRPCQQLRIVLYPPVHFRMFQIQDPPWFVWLKLDFVCASLNTTGQQKGAKPTTTAGRYELSATAREPRRMAHEQRSKMTASISIPYL